MPEAIEQCLQVVSLQSPSTQHHRRRKNSIWQKFCNLFFEYKYRSDITRKTPCLMLNGIPLLFPPSWKTPKPWCHNAKCWTRTSRTRRKHLMSARSRGWQTSENEPHGLPVLAFPMPRRLRRDPSRSGSWSRCGGRGRGSWKRTCERRRWRWCWLVRWLAFWMWFGLSRREFVCWLNVFLKRKWDAWLWIAFFALTTMMFDALWMIFFSPSRTQRLYTHLATKDFQTFTEYRP